VSPIDVRSLLPNAHTVSEPTCTKSKGLPIDVPFYTYTFYTCNAAYKKHGTPDRRPFPFLYFLHVHCCVQKCKRLLIDVSFYPYSFYIHNDTYKKQGAPDRRLIPSLYFLYAQCGRLSVDGHYTFHTQSSSAYEKARDVFISIIQHISGIQKNRFNTIL
jgi:hypothetical protein